MAVATAVFDNVMDLRQDGLSWEREMSTPDLSDLFTPGAGAVPSYLAGRKEEQATFQACVKSLKNGRSPSRDLILYGPRGNGKTALLRYLQTKTRQQEGSSLGVLWATPRELANPGKLVDLIIGDYATLRSKIQSAGFSFHFGIAKADTQVDLSKRPLTLGDLLQERCQHQPLILIVDEAHRLDPQMGEDLLNASQNARAEGCPFLLVLAGTPNLEVTLRKANASFWDRGKQLPLGRLSPQEAGEALTIPLQKAGITFAPGVLEHIVAQTHCYPFFTQVWGDCLARRLDGTQETKITTKTVKAVEAAVIDERDAMYRVRRNEIDDEGLLSIAESIAEAFIQGGALRLYERDLKEAIAQGMADDGPITDQSIREKLKQLSHLGYVWQSKAGGYEPGIPSLLSYVSRQAQLQGKARLPVADQVEKWHINPKSQDVDIEM